MRILVNFIFLLLLLNLTNCSYIMDSVEGAFTNRASFSIDAYYTSDKKIHLTWSSESSSNEGFAGYEIYMTSQPDSEYANYETVAARFTIGSSPTTSGISFDTEYESLKYNNFVLDITNIHKAGNYFFRVGVINYDSYTDSNNVKHYYAEIGSDSQNDYQQYSIFNSISGYEMVYIPIP